MDEETRFVDVATDDLLNEVLSRFDHAVFIGHQDRMKDRSRIVRRWKGNAHTISGLAHDVANVVLADMHERSEYSPQPEDEEGG